MIARCFLRPSGRRRIGRRFRAAAGLLAIGLGSSLANLPVRADEADEADATERSRAVMMQRFVVSATRIERNPWRYASVPGFEVLTRGSEHDTDWLLDALRRGMWIEDKVMPKDWLPASAVPYMVIIDDTDISAAPASDLHALPQTLSSPTDALTWGDLSEDIHLSNDSIGSYDGDTVAINDNLYGARTDLRMDSTISLERLGRGVPPLPGWLTAGLVGQTSGIFREAFSILLEDGTPSHRASGPGTLWVSLGETQRMLKALKRNPHDPSIVIPSVRRLFVEAPPLDREGAVWESEAALFVRWGLMNRDAPTSGAFLEFVRRARLGPVSESMFVDCFGFGYSTMDERLRAYLPKVLAEPTSIEWDMPTGLLVPVDLREATSDQIGRILGDWLRMKGNFFGESDPAMSKELLRSAGRMLERAYRDDNGLPPDVDRPGGGGPFSTSARTTEAGPVVAMRPFVVVANRVHDPRLQAVYGLYEHDIGDDGKAREFLEAAVKAGVVRPNADVALAEIRYAGATDKPEGSAGKISAAQAAPILKLLNAAAQAAPTADTCKKIVEVWMNGEVKPTPADVELLVAGVAMFPRDADLAYGSAQVCARFGYTAEASAVIDKGLAFTTHEINRDYFEQLRSTLRIPPAP